MNRHSAIYEWVVGYEGAYLVSDLGTIISVPRENLAGNMRKGKELSQKTGTTGYKIVELYRDGKQKSLFVHRLVAEAFIGPIPKKYVVDHIDDDKVNNNSWNLQIITPRQNTAKAFMKHKSSNTPVGVYKHRNRYSAHITYDGVKHHLGSFTTVEEAEKAYKNAIPK